MKKKLEAGFKEIITYRLNPGLSIPTTWKAGTDPEGEEIGKPENIDAKAANDSYYAGREGIIEGYRGTFLFFVVRSDGRAYAQRRPKGECTGDCCNRKRRR